MVLSSQLPQLISDYTVSKCLHSSEVIAKCLPSLPDIIQQLARWFVLHMSSALFHHVLKIKPLISRISVWCYWNITWYSPSNITQIPNLQIRCLFRGQLYQSELLFTVHECPDTRYAFDNFSIYVQTGFSLLTTLMRANNILFATFYFYKLIL